MKLSAAFATSLDSPEHIRLAEDLGYHRAWLYDGGPMGADVWMMLALAAERTARIGLGPGVLVPSLRHPAVTASAAVALEGLAPGRVALGLGTGFAGRTMGGGPIPWSYMTRYIEALRGLLRGETVEWDGGKVRMQHPAASAFPVEIPIYVAAQGPKGLAVARDMADGLFALSSVPEQAQDFPEIAYLAWGTVLDEQESDNDERVRAAGGPGLMALVHGGYEMLGEDFVSALPGGRQWLEVVHRAPKDERHLVIHKGHLRYLNEADEAAWDAGAHTLLRDLTLSGTVEEVRTKVERYADQGVTELVYGPMTDVERELRMMAGVVGDLVSA